MNDATLMTPAELEYRQLEARQQMIEGKLRAHGYWIEIDDLTAEQRACRSAPTITLLMPVEIIE